jgi:hypothetical protein
VLGVFASGEYRQFLRLTGTLELTLDRIAQ